MSPVYILFVRTFTWGNFIYVTTFCVMCSIMPGFQWKLLDGGSVLMVLELSLALLTLMLNSGISLTSAEKGHKSSPTYVSLLRLHVL